MTDFEALYQNNPDPWDVHKSWYEQRKQSVLLACLPQARYSQALELGCGTGALTLQLARRCGKLQAVDISTTAIAHCQAVLEDAGIVNVQPCTMRIPQTWPEDPAQGFDLIVVSELAYYLDDDALETFIAQCLRSLAQMGEFVMCHYLPDFHDRLQATVFLHQRLNEASALTHLIRHHDEHFLLDIWRKKTR